MCLKSKVEIQTEEPGKSFADHITYVHDFWSYCNFLIYLSQKNKEDMNGLEGFIRDQIDDTINTWVPTSNKQLEEEASRKQIEETEKAVNEKIDKIKITTDTLEKNVTDVQEKIKAIQEELAKVGTSVAESTKTEMEALKQKIDTIIEAVTKK